MTRCILPMLACCLLSACAAGPMPMPDPMPPPANLTTPPAPLPPPASGALRDLEANHRTVARLYHQLAIRYCGLLQHLQVSHDPQVDGCTRYLAERR